MSNVDTDQIQVFGNKSLSSLLEDIYNNSTEKNDRIEGLVDQLSNLIKTKDHAIVLVPLIKEYLDVSVSNDQQLIKIAQIIQRLHSAQMRSSEDGGAGRELSDAEKDELRNMAKELRDARDDDIKKLTDKKDDAVEELEVEE